MIGRVEGVEMGVNRVEREEEHWIIAWGFDVGGMGWDCVCVGYR